MSANRISLMIAALAAVAIAVVVVASGGIELPSLGGGDDERPATAEAEAPAAEEAEEAEEPEAAELPEAEPQPVLPDNPDEVRGSDPYALTRPANLRRALGVLERKRAEADGVFDGLRIAPGRIDTVIVHPDDRRTNIQIRPDFEIAFESTHDFPTRPDFRKGGLNASDVKVNAPQRLLRAIDRKRRGSAERDVDYVVIRKDIIDFDVELSAYMRIRTPHPRMFRWEGGKAVPIG